MNSHKIALFGTSGEASYRLATEALYRGHNVTAIVPDENDFQLEHPNLRVVKGDIKNREDVRRYAKGNHVVICAPEPTKTHTSEFMDITRVVIEGVKDSGVNNLLFATHPLGLPTETDEEFYNFLKPVVQAQRESLKLFQNEKGLHWGYARSIEPEAEQKKGKYHISHEIIFTYPQGESRIKEIKYSSALIDEAEKDAI